MVIPEIKREKGEPALEDMLPDFLKKSRWFSGKGRIIEGFRIVERLAPPKLKQWHGHCEKTILLIVEVTYAEGPCERYFVPLTLMQGQWVDAFQSPEFCKFLLNKIIRLSAGEKLTPKLLETEQSNTSVIFGNRFILKVYRKFVAGKNIEQEIGLHLTQMGFPNTPKMIGTLNMPCGEKIVPMGILHAFIPETKNGWDFTCEALTQAFERAQKSHSLAISGFLPVATRLGKRTAELHLALSGDIKNKDFSPEPYGTLYQQSLYQSLRNQVRLTFRKLRHGLTSLPSNVVNLATEVLLQEQTVLNLFSELRTRPLRSHKIRIHGDYHLGQVLYTGSDFMIIDFEGEPARTLSDRMRKRSALYDVAGMLRSFHYATAVTLIQHGDDKKKLLSKWAEVWYRAVSQAFLNSYINTAGKTAFLPEDPHERGFLLTISLIEKVLYEIRYEQNNRPAWLRIPLVGLLDILKEEGCRHHPL